MSHVLQYVFLVVVWFVSWMMRDLFAPAIHGGSSVSTGEREGERRREGERKQYDSSTKLQMRWSLNVSVYASLLLDTTSR